MSSEFELAVREKKLVWESYADHQAHGAFQPLFSMTISSIWTPTEEVMTADLSSTSIVSSESFFLRLVPPRREDGNHSLGEAMVLLAPCDLLCWCAHRRCGWRGFRISPTFPSSLYLTTSPPLATRTPLDRFPVKAAQLHSTYSTWPPCLDVYCMHSLRIYFLSKKKKKRKKKKKESLPRTWTRSLPCTTKRPFPSFVYIVHHQFIAGLLLTAPQSPASSVYMAALPIIASRPLTLWIAWTRCW